jgi:para-aminobenzoate synthetase
VTDIRPEELCATIKGLAPRCGQTVVVALDGPSGSGKTVLARELATLLGESAQILHFDHVYPGWDRLADAPPVVDDDILQPISRGKTGRTPRWDWGADQPGDYIIFAPSRFLLLDGCGSGARVIRPYLSYLLWLEAPADVRRVRVSNRGDDTVDQWWDMWAAQESAHFTAEGTRAAADVVCRS